MDLAHFEKYYFECETILYTYSFFIHLLIET